VRETITGYSVSYTHLDVYKRQPLLKPNQNEREGYVPNVVYTCGALVHSGELIIPYGMADNATGFATVALAEVLAAMEREAPSPA